MKKQGIALAAAAGALLLSGCASWKHDNTPAQQPAAAPAATTAQQPAPATPTQRAVLLKDHSSCKGHGGWHQHSES
jgi:PBP1b-binding outer membrane lipoprotein LpoB